MESYDFTPKHVYEIWLTFIKFDKDNDGYINLDDLYVMFQEHANSIIAPYLERFYDLIDKVEPDKVYFEEFLEAAAAFCLFTKDEMVIFVFNMLDRDRDAVISKKDCFRHVMLERDKKPIFPNNLLRAIELFECDRGDRISRKDFLRLVKDVPYLIFPAFRLQEEMRSILIGPRFWHKTYVKVEKKNFEQKRLEEREKIKEREMHKADTKYAERVQRLEENLVVLNKQEEEKKRVHELDMVRVPRKRASD